jgi:hypothetical protein
LDWVVLGGQKGGTGVDFLGFAAISPLKRIILLRSAQFSSQTP